VRFLVEDAEFGARNREVLAGWVADWLPQAEQAGVALAPLAPIGVDAQRALLGVRRSSAELLGQVGLQPSRTAPAGSRRRTRGRAAPTPARKRAEAGGELPVQPAAPRLERGAGGQSLPDGNGTYDYVGIVMAKSAEGDAVAAILGRRDGVVVQEQPAFWDICARDRLVIPYDEVSADLGYEIDAYSIQHEMSTHYGRMVATDEALLLFSDPTEAMEHLMA
jgi:propane monooxygenase coupling protein